MEIWVWTGWENSSRRAVAAAAVAVALCLDVFKKVHFLRMFSPPEGGHLGRLQLLYNKNTDFLKKCIFEKCVSPGGRTPRSTLAFIQKI